MTLHGNPNLVTFDFKLDHKKSGKPGKSTKKWATHSVSVYPSVKLEDIVG